MAYWYIIYIAFHTKITTACVNAKRKKKKNPSEIIDGVIAQPSPNEPRSL